MISLQLYLDRVIKRQKRKRNIFSYIAQSESRKKKLYKYLKTLN